jgi:excisionase family DNA binding protein
MADALTVAETAEELGTSRQTILNLVHDGTLRGTQSPSGVWRVRRKSVDSFLAKYGRLNGGRRRKSASAVLQDEVRQLREQVAHLTNALGGQETAELMKERDDLRARVVGLEDALATIREAVELQRQADAERSQVIEDLLAALVSSERADSLRRQALQTLEDGLAGSVMPGHPGAAS